MGGPSVLIVDELVRQRQEELSRFGASRRGRRPERRGRRRATGARPVRRVGRMLVAVGLRLAGPDAVAEANPLSA